MILMRMGSVLVLIMGSGKLKSKIFISEYILFQNILQLNVKLINSMHYSYHI